MSRDYCSLDKVVNLKANVAGCSLCASPGTQEVILHMGFQRPAALFSQTVVDVSRSQVCSRVALARVHLFRVSPCRAHASRRPERGLKPRDYILDWGDTSISISLASRYSS